MDTTLTVSQIALRCNVTQDSVYYVLRTRKIKPVRWVGHARLFSAEDAEFIEREVSRIAARRGAKEAR